MRLAFLLLLYFSSYASEAQYIAVSNFHDTLDADIELHLKDQGYKMVTSYYDNVNEVDGKWQHYPSVKITKNLIAIAVSKIPDVENKYTYLIVFSKEKGEVSDILGPYYDTFIDAVKTKIKKGEIAKLHVRLLNPPEQFEPKYTFVQYDRQKGKLVETKSYEKE